MTTGAMQFDPIKYKQTTREQWQAAAEAWHRWQPIIEQWLGSATNGNAEFGKCREGQSCA